MWDREQAEASTPAELLDSHPFGRNLSGQVKVLVGVLGVIPNRDGVCNIRLDLQSKLLDHSKGKVACLTDERRLIR